MRVVILGARGMLGQELVRAFSTHEVFAWDKQECNILDNMRATMALDQAKPDILVNATGYNLVDQAEGEGREMAQKLNVDAPTFLAAYAQARDIPFVHYSTAYVFDGTRGDGYAENDAPHPQSVYARTKHDGERAVMHAHPGAYVIRLNWLFGRAAQSPDAKRSFVDRIITLARERSQLELVDDEYGSITYAPDLAQQTQTLLTEHPAGLYHAVNEGVATWYSWAEECFRLLDLHPHVTPVSTTRFPRTVRPPACTVLHCTKCPPMRPWQDALCAYLHSSDFIA
ncbi:dTDP-4-dehydrorhamnose reductase [Candidatus Uhrbacteria bacterium]|nr:dTDP-4-dehydrorhamnose reductase [Candidatus Uhrbacteria bacterium]